MFQSFLRLLPVYAVGVYAFGMGMFWAAAGLSRSTPYPPGDPGAYIAVGLLGAAVVHSLRDQERRIQELERQLRERGGDA